MQRMRPIARIRHFRGCAGCSRRNSRARRRRGRLKAGREKARQWEGYHGLDGLSKIPEAPNIAGQNENYLIEQLNAFKTGERRRAT